MVRTSVISLLLLGLASGCSSSSGVSRDAHPAADSRTDSPIRTDSPTTNKDGPGSPRDGLVPASDSPVVSDSGTAKDAPARDTLVTDTYAGADSPIDAWAACTPGFDLSCNHIDESAAPAGTCQANGTCVCKPGYAIVPSSGRCWAQTPSTGDAATTDAELACSSPYLSCVCQCCASAPHYVACYYPTAGETLQAIKDKEAADRSVTNCAGAGCSSGTRYVCCTPAAPEPSSAATYSAGAYSGDMDHITINKVGTSCAQILLSRPAKTRTGFHLDGASGWGLMGASFGACTDASYTESVEGALGTVALHGEGKDCTIDVHMTIYDLSATGEMKTTRMDIDGLSVDGLFSCR